MQIHRALLSVVVVVTAACSAPGDTRVAESRTTSEAQNEALIRQVLELINDRNLDAAFEFYAPDYIYHGPGGQELRGRDAIRGLWAVFLTGFPDLHSTVDDVISEGDKLVLRWTVQGTHTGEFLGIPASNKQMTLPITEIFRIADGQLVEAWDQYDNLHLMEQIDAIPASTMAVQAEDEAAVRKVVDQLIAAFNNHDAKGMGAHGDLSVGESWDGSGKWTAENEGMADLFRRQPSIKNKLLEEIGIIFFTPDVAVYKARMDNTGLVDEDGKALPQLKWLGAWVMVKKNGKWLSAAFFSRPIEE